MTYNKKFNEDLLNLFPLVVNEGGGKVKNTIDVYVETKLYFKRKIYEFLKLILI